MKKSKYKLVSLLFLLIVTITTGFSQSQDIAFTMQMQNADIHEAVIYPNPVTDFRFKIKSEQIIYSVEVINVIGKCVNKQINSNNSIEDILITLGGCDKGMYLVKITFDDDAYIIKKLLVK